MQRVGADPGVAMVCAPFRQDDQARIAGLISRWSVNGHCRSKLGSGCRRRHEGLRRLLRVWRAVRMGWQRRGWRCEHLRSLPRCSLALPVRLTAQILLGATRGGMKR